jgi:hypothetical protein
VSWLREYGVFGIGTALVDFFTHSTDEFLIENGLVKGATNFLPWDTLDKLHETVSGSIFIRLPGDNARNVCEGFSYLGGRPAYGSSIGKDREGEFFTRSLENQKIASFLVERPGRTGRILVFITPDHQRTFAVNLGNSLDYDVLPKREIEKSTFLYLTSITFLARGKIGKNAGAALELAKEVGTKVAFSLESPPMIEQNREKLLKIIQGVDVLFVNEEELTALTGRGEDTARELSEKVGLLCLKKAQKGSVLFTRDEEFQIPCYSKKTVDTTGAGDFYAAGVLFGLSKGMDAEKAGHVGAELAGKVVERFGATLSKI